ncbi:MAG: glucosyltransferase domain-containing protein [Dokdonella sp.]
MAHDTPQLAAKARSLQLFGALFLGFFLLILLPILRADRYCNDDILRALDGNWGWNTDGRLFTNFLMRLLEFGAVRVVDIAPLPQLLAIAVLACFGVLVARRYRIDSVPIAALIAFPMAAQPFFLHNLSFRFDAFCMALAMLCAFLPLLSSTLTVRAWAVGAACLLACLNLYQPAIGVFLVFALLETIAEPAPEQTWGATSRRFVGRMLQCAAALLAYRLFFAASFKGWLKDRSEVAPLTEVPHTLFANAQGFGHVFASSFSARWFEIFVPLLLIALAAIVVLSVCARGTPARRMMAAAYAVVLVPAMLLAACGPMLLLRHPVYAPRVMVGFGAVLCAALIAMHGALRGHRHARGLQYFIAGALALAMSVHAAVLGNAAAAQKDYEAAIAGHLADDLAELAQRQSVGRYLILGSAGLAPTAAHAAEQFPLLQVLVPTYLDEHEVWRHHYLRLFLPPIEDAAFPDGAVDASLALRSCAHAPTLVRSAYQLSVVDDVAIVRFKSAFCSEPARAADVASPAT